MSRAKPHNYSPGEESRPEYARYVKARRVYYRAAQKAQAARTAYHNEIERNAEAGKKGTAKNGAGGAKAESKESEETQASRDLLAGKTVIVRNEAGNHFMVSAKPEGEGSYRVEVRRADYLGRVGAEQAYGGRQRYSPSQTARLTVAQIHETSHDWQHVSSHADFKEGLRAIRKTPDALRSRLDQLHSEIRTLRAVTDPAAKHYRTPRPEQMAKYHARLKSAEAQAAKIEKSLGSQSAA